MQYAPKFIFGICRSIGIVLSQFLVLLTFFQYLEARKERIKAEDALREAITARDISQEAAGRATKTAEQIQKINNELCQQALLSASMSYLQLEANAAFILSGNDPELIKRTKIARDELLKEINNLIAHAIPNQKEREEYNANLMQRVDVKK